MRLLLLLAFISIPMQMFALDPQFDIRKIDTRKFVSDTSNNLQNGRVTKSASFDYYTNRVKVTFTAEKKNPQNLYLFFERDSHSMADLVSLLHDVVDYYYADAGGMLTSAAYDGSEVETDYKFYLGSSNGVQIYTRISNTDGLRVFGVLISDGVSTLDGLNSFLREGVESEVISDTIDHDKLANNTFYFKDSISSAKDFVIALADNELVDLGSGGKWFSFFKVFRTGVGDDGLYHFKIKAEVIEPNILQDPYLNSIQFSFGFPISLSLYEILNSSDTSGYTFKSDHPLMSISCFLSPTAEQYATIISKIVLKIATE